MTAIDTRAFTRTPTQANLLRIILRLYEKTNLTRDGHKVLSIQLDRFATMIGCRAKSTIHAALCWLEDHGIIQIIRDRWNRSPRLYIRPLIKPRRTSTEREPNVTGSVDRTSYKHPSEKSIIHQSTGGDAPAPRKRREFRDSVEGASDRVQKKQEATRARAGRRGPSPVECARVWNRLLSEYGYPSFDPEMPKHLSAIKKTIATLGEPTLDDFRRALEGRIAMWQNARPDRFKKTPPHPWAINRCWALFEDDDMDRDENEPTFTEQAPAPVEKDSQPEKPVVEERKKGILQQLFSGSKQSDGK